MKTFRLALLLTVAVAGCGRLQSKEPTMLRSFGGRLVPGHYVSPGAYEHYIRAQLAANEGRADEAVEELRQAIGADGASAYLRMRLAEELMALGRLDQAREEAQAALHLDPRFADGHVTMARIRLRLREPREAEAHLKRAIEAERGCEEAYVQLAELQRQERQVERAEATLRELVRQVPASVVAHEGLGRAAMARRDFKTAMLEYERVLDLDAGRQSVWEPLATLYQAEGRVEQALTLLRDAYDRSAEGKYAEAFVRLLVRSGRMTEARTWLEELGEQVEDPVRRLWVGWRFLEVGQPERSQEIAEQVRTSTHAPAAQLLLGRALVRIGQLDAAMEELGKLAPNVPEFAAAQVQLAKLLRDGGRFQEAVERVEQALSVVTESRPGSSMTESLQGALADLHERAGRRAEAIRLLEEARAQQPDSEELALALAAAYQRAGQRPRALELGSEVVARHPESARALNFLGFTLVQAGQRLDKAQHLLERAAMLQPLSGEVADSLGWLYSKTGRLDEAERLLVRADRLLPEQPEILQHLGELYLRKSDRTKATDAFRRALAYQPDEALRQSIEHELLLLETGKLMAGSQPPP